MMREFKLVIPVLLIVFFSLSASAYDPKEGNITATFGPFIYKTNFSGSDSGAKSPVLGGFGLVAAGDLTTYGSLEIAMIYMNKIFFRDDGGKYIAQKSQMMHITTGYRRWLNPYLSTSLALFTAYPMGDAETLHNDFVGTIAPDTSVSDLYETGLELAVQGQLWEHEKTAIILEVRYAYELTAKKNEHADHYGMMLGLRYYIQEGAAGRANELKEKEKLQQQEKKQPLQVH